MIHKQLHFYRLLKTDTYVAYMYTVINEDLSKPTWQFHTLFRSGYRISAVCATDNYSDVLWFFLDRRRQHTIRNDFNLNAFELGNDSAVFILASATRNWCN